MSITSDAQGTDKDLEQVEAKLRLKDERFTRFMAGLPGGVCLIRGRVFSQINHAFCQLVGRSESELRALSSPLNFARVADRSRAEKTLLSVMDGGEAKQSCRFLVTREGVENLEVEAVFLALPSEGGPLVACCLDDISETRRLKESLRELEERFRFASRATQELIWECTLSNQRLWCNEGIMTVFKYKPDQAPKTLEQFVEAVHPDERESVSVGIKSLMSAARPFWLSEFRFLRGDGGYAHVLARAFLLYDSERKPIRLIGSMLDHTRQKQLESQFLETQRLSGIGTIARGLAHDVNNILTPVLTAAQRLKEEVFLDEKQAGLLETIERNCLRGSKLMDNIMNYAKGGAEEDNVRPLDIGGLIESVALMFRETFPRNIEITYDSSENLHQIEADELQFEQILMNLCINARDSMPHGGRLALTARNKTPDSYFLLAHPDVKHAPYVVIRVQDEGIGYTADEQKTLFDPSMETVTDSFLGLVTVKTLVDKLNGVIEIVSSPDKGTTFEIYFPAAEGVKEEAEPNLDDLLVDGGGETVLLVDDEPKICELSQESLECHGYRVISARDGAAAVSLYCQHRMEIAAVLMDLKMPVMDGVTAIRVLRGMNSKIKIIATTGSVRNQNELDLGHVRTDGFLRKPYTTASLLKMLKEVINRQ